MFGNSLRRPVLAAFGGMLLLSAAGMAGATLGYSKDQSGGAAPIQQVKASPASISIAVKGSRSSGRSTG